MKKIVKFIASIYLVLFVIFWLYCMFNIFLSKGFLGVQETLSPFNIANWVITLVLLLPYFVLLAIEKGIASKTIDRK